MGGKKINERVLTGHIVSWINEAINEGRTVFEYVTNDEGIKLDSGKTLFPDILLFTNKVSGEVFNGWELKDPQTPVDDREMLLNALAKAEKLGSNSFVTWNCVDAIIWEIADGNYTIDGLTKLKVYPSSKNITCKDDIKVQSRYIQHEAELKSRTNEILHDLGELYRNGALRPAIDVSGTIVEAIRQAYDKIVPQFTEAIKGKRATDKHFRREFQKWKVYESAMLKILETSSRRAEHVVPEQILAKLTFYNLVGKIVFYFFLRANLQGDLEEIKLTAGDDAKTSLNLYFDQAREIDYQAIFQPYFTDDIEYSETANAALASIIASFSRFDFHNLPSGVIGHILDNLVPDEERQKFGQYYTSEVLADLVAFPAVQSTNGTLFDPTSGSGTFLTSFYRILKYYNPNLCHSEILDRVWGNDVSHFPALLSVINLYKQDVVSTNNFPRVTRDDFFNLEVDAVMRFPDPHDYHKHCDIRMPRFNGIASNFPFIQQEDNPSEMINDFFRAKFQKKQQAFLKDNEFAINERSDYFTYCVYNSYRFLADGGILSVITSNAWLGKDYGLQFKRFLLSNFHIRYIVRSQAEHWFTDSQVSTIYMVLEKGASQEPTKFVSLNFKLNDYFSNEDVNQRLGQIEDLYTSIDLCDDPRSGNWTRDNSFCDLYKRNDGKVSVCIVKKDTLVESLNSEDNWSQYFTSSHIFNPFGHCLIRYSPNLFTPFRGERTGWDPMFIIPTSNVSATAVASKYLVPCVKSSTELKSITFNDKFENQLFVCSEKFAQLDDGTKSWISRFANQLNKNQTRTIEQSCSGHKPFWYTLRPKMADIVTSINPYERFFFTFSDTPIAIGQRLIALKVNDKYNVELMAALLNSAIIFLEIELKGTNRSLGVLDLNANYIKALRFLNPDVLSDSDKEDIINKFRAISHRNILPIYDEVKQSDRIEFDEVILKAYGIDTAILPDIYELLVSSVAERVTMRDR